jgi:hypothetical protein
MFCMFTFPFKDSQKYGFFFNQKQNFTKNIMVLRIKMNLSKYFEFHLKN